MIHTSITPDTQREPLGGLVAAIHKARTSNPEAKPLPAGFIEHSQELPDYIETWAQRDFTALETDQDVPVFRSRAAR